MYKRAAVAFISFWSLAAAAADWQVVADTELGQLKMDKASVAKEGKYTTAVLVYEFKGLQKLTTPPNSVFNKRQDNVLVDCATPALGLQTSKFFEDGKFAHSQTRNAADVKLVPTAPDSMAATVVQAVCAVPLPAKL
ncbi:MAG TPA: surface-adhesin E family protein [Gallionella sp.]|nr:surface-adhesin E family protein [Gallionella sp.]